jgi:hypothetical protein
MVEGTDGADDSTGESPPDWRAHVKDGTIEAIEAVGDELRRVRFDRETVAPSVAVVAAVAAERGCTPVEVPSLFAAVDPEALDGLFPLRDAGSAGSVEFAFGGFAVTVYGTGEVALARPETA